MEYRILISPRLARAIYDDLSHFNRTSTCGMVQPISEREMPLHSYGIFLGTVAVWLASINESFRRPTPPESTINCVFLDRLAPHRSLLSLC